MITIELGELPIETYYLVLHWLETDNIEHEEEWTDDLGPGYIETISLHEEDAIIMRLKLNI